MLLRRGVDVAQPAARPDVCDPCVGIDHHLVHRRHVEQQTPIRDRDAGDVVSTAPDAEAQPVVAGEPDRRCHVGAGLRLVHKGGLSVDHPVPQLHAVGPAVVPWPQPASRCACSEPIELRRVDLDATLVHPGDLDHGRGHRSPSPCHVVRGQARGYERPRWVTSVEPRRSRRLPMGRSLHADQRRGGSGPAVWASPGLRPADFVGSARDRRAAPHAGPVDDASGRRRTPRVDSGPSAGQLALGGRAVLHGRYRQPAAVLLCRDPSQDLALVAGVPRLRRDGRGPVLDHRRR